MSQPHADAFLVAVQEGVVPLRSICNDAHTHIRDCTDGPVNCPACVYAVALFHVLSIASGQLLDLDRKRPDLSKMGRN